jgi:hypothetical protein
LIKTTLYPLGYSVVQPVRLGGVINVKGLRNPSQEVDGEWRVVTPALGVGVGFADNR